MIACCNNDDPSLKCVSLKNFRNVCFNVKNIKTVFDGNFQVVPAGRIGRILIIKKIPFFIFRFIPNILSKNENKVKGPGGPTFSFLLQNKEKLQGNVLSSGWKYYKIIYKHRFCILTASIFWSKLFF